MIGNKLICVDKIASSNLYLKALLKNNQLEEGSLVCAKQQTAGKGQRGNVWSSEFDKNLLFSFVLYPKFLSAQKQFLLSKIVALGIYDVLKQYLQNVKIKWPNDIYVNDMKIAGILIENSLSGMNIDNTIVGIGLNVNQVNFDKSIPNPTSMQLETGKFFNKEYILKEVCNSLDSRYNTLYNNDIGGLNESYLNALYQYKQAAKYKDCNGEFIAEIVGIDKIGMLCLLDENGDERKYAFKEVEFCVRHAQTIN